MRWMETAVQDLRFALRLLAKERWFTAAAVAALALGMGVTTMMVTIINGYNFRGLSVPGSGEVVHVGTVDFSGRTPGVSYPDFLDWRRDARSFEALAAFAGRRVAVSEPGRAPEGVGGVYLSAASFGILQAAPLLGRGLVPDDDRRDAAPVVVLGYRLWAGRYGSDPSILGRSVLIDGVPATVVGVMPEGFEFPFRHGIWLPLAGFPGLETQARDDRTLSAFGRLAGNTSADEARAELEMIAGGLARVYPQTNDRIRPRVVPFGVEQVGRFGDDPVPVAILGTALVVLLIACANVANLLLARSGGRARELAIRASLGATRWRIARQLLVESLVLSAIATTVGLWLSTFGVRFIAESFGRNVPYWMSFPIDLQVLAAAAVLCVLATMLFGLAPALVFSRVTLAGSMKESAPAGGGRRFRGWTQALLVAELAVTVMLLAGAGLLLRSFFVLYQSDNVLDVSQVLTMEVTLPAQTFATSERRSEFYRQLDERIGRMPGLALATVASSRPFTGALSRTLTFADRQPAAGDAGRSVAVVAAGPRYFDALQVPAVRGRLFTALDGAPGQAAAIVNQRFVDVHYAGADPLGQRIRLSEPKTDPALASWLTIVGVVPTIRQGMASAGRPVVYVPLAAHGGENAAILVRTESAGAAVAALRTEVASLDPDVTLFNVRPLPDLRNDSRLQPRLIGTVLTAFAGIALLLSVVGVFAATAYAVRQRRHEIGVRMALGAQAPQVVWLFVRRGLALLAIGLPTGLAGAVVVGLLLRGLLIQTRPADPIILLVIAGLVIGFTLAACLIPARRAAHREPLAVLRTE